jgi:cyclophilin family peptidyl-prolyl cis-trans isomerase
MNVYSALGVFILACPLAYGATPTIVSQPAALTINAGSTATFSVTATNATGYQWQFKGTNLTGETSATLLMENVSTNQAGAYQVLVKGTDGVVTSSSAKLSVIQGTLVQFNIAGTNVIVELFDHDKPGTVQNFIHYVKAGIYTNTFFHQLTPGFCIQGGGYGTARRSSSELIATTNIYDLYSYASTALNGNLPPYIVNEFSTGPKVRNTYGTLAMAKIEGYDISSSSEWLFNLADNSADLDDQNGGYTVFGRVIQGDGVLDYLSNSSSGIGITNLSSLWTNTGDVFEELPFKANGLTSIYCGDLIYANIKLLSKVTDDTTIPKITIAYPPKNAVLTNSDYTIKGNVADKGVIAFMQCWLYKYPRSTNEILGVVGEIMNMGPKWSVPLTNQTSGNYRVYMVIWDGYGHQSYTYRDYAIGERLTVNIEGPGTVSKNLNGSYLEIGRASGYGTLKTYSMTAKPAKGAMFAGWYGLGKVITTPTIKFNMSTNLVLSAKFVTNYYPSLAAKYNGLFAESTTNRVESSGFVTIKTTSAGVYSGQLQIAGKTASFSGAFDYTGHSSLVVTPSKTTNKLTLNLEIDLTNNSGTILGTVSNQNWTASLLAYKGVGKLTANSNPKLGNYVLIVPGTPTFSTNGTLKITATASGLLKLTGSLADKSAVVQSVYVSKDGYWPVYETFNNGTGMIWGWEVFTATNCNGTLHWIKPSTSDASGFSRDVWTYINP